MTCDGRLKRLAHGRDCAVNVIRDPINVALAISALCTLATFHLSRKLLRRGVIGAGFDAALVASRVFDLVSVPSRVRHV